MFGKKDKKTTFAAGGTTLISKNTEVVGDIHFSGTLMIEGHIKGNVYAVDADNAQARVLESGKVEGEIRVPSLVINGSVTGNVYSSKHIELAAKTVINGNVHYSLIEIVKGAQVNGSLVYSTKPFSGKASEAAKAPSTLSSNVSKSPVLPVGAAPSKV
jgi:cytoskeletal protein CcmA (bactofilin family)